MLLSNWFLIELIKKLFLFGFYCYLINVIFEEWIIKYIKYYWLNLRFCYLLLICLVLVMLWLGFGVRNLFVICWLLLLLVWYIMGVVVGL